MSEMINLPEQMVFGLDIGTRSVVGSVGYMDDDRFKVVAHYVKEHETRAMLDGQIHDISAVGNTVKEVKEELEKQIGRPLKEVCIAAAGRVLKTLTVHIEVSRDGETAVTGEEIYGLDSVGIDKAYEDIRRQYEDISFYCVGYSVIKYYMNGFYINNLEGHKAKKIGADVLATFLPNDVIEGLYSAVSIAGLEVKSLTLEPIAAINIAIPENFRLLNIALVDVGAGTSDISITKDGTIVAYGMIPHAGDEITEAIAHKCLIDFKNAEQLKRASIFEEEMTYTDILGIPNKVTSKKIRSIYAPTVDNTTKEIADKIIELNGDKTVNAVFVVGGGGKAHGFTDKLAKHLNIPKERVALRGEEVLTDVDFLVGDVVKDPLLVTPIGICVNYYNQNNNFVYVTFNDKKVKMYDNGRLTVIDVVAQENYPNEALFPKRGKSINYTLNGEKKMIKGSMGEPAVILVNGEPANINTRIRRNDNISIISSKAGDEVDYMISMIPGFRSKLKFSVNGNLIECPKFITVNGETVTEDYVINEEDDIESLDYYTIEQILQYMDIPADEYVVEINGHTAGPGEPVYESFSITVKEKSFKDYAKEYTSDALLEDEDDYLIYEKKPQAEPVKDNSALFSAIGEAVAENAKDAQDKIYVIVNTKVVNLSGKTSYIFVDILDFYPFDTKKAGGTEVVMTINGNPASFTDSIKDGDIIDLYWK